MLIYTSRKSRCSSAGRALPWGGRGRRFKSCHLDQIKPNGFSPFGFISFIRKALNLPSTSPARKRRGWSGFPKASIYELWGFTVVRRRFKSCHLDQSDVQMGVRFFFIYQYFKGILELSSKCPLFFTVTQFLDECYTICYAVCIPLASHVTRQGFDCALYYNY